MILDLDAYKASCGARTKEELIQRLRSEYGSGQTIASLASTELKSADPELLVYCDREMAWFFDDLGNCFYDCLSGVIQAMQNGKLLAYAPTTGDLRGKWEDRPCIILGAGPSASERWDAIKTSRSHAILIVCDVMLKPCLERGIIPDFVSAQERIPLVYESLKGLDTTGITLIAPPVIEPRVVELFDGRVIWCWRGCGMELWMAPEIPRNNFGRSCGVQGIGAAMIAGCSPIYLVGHDLCMQAGATHADGAHESTSATRSHIESDKDDYHRRQPAKSISGRDVTTTHLWGMFKSDIEHIRREHPWITVINTGDGLPISGTIPGEMPDWSTGQRIGKRLPPALAFDRANPGKNPASMIPQMLDDITWIERACEHVMAKDKPTAEDMKLSEMVSDETAGVWTEIYGGTYASALIRLHLQPGQHIPILKRVALTVQKTLPMVRDILKEINA